MIKRILMCLSFFMLIFCNVHAAVSEWKPDFTPQCGRNEKTRNKYLKNEKDAVKHSLVEMKKRGINIIPTPKNLIFSGENINLSATDLAEKVTIYADESSEIATGILFDKLGKSIKIKKLNDNKNLSKISILLLRKDINANNPLLPKDIPNFYQGYVIKTLDNNGKRTYILAGKDYTGLLYATITFRKLMTNKNGYINFPSCNVSDWPDIRYRVSGALWYKFRSAGGESTRGGEKYIDWLLNHKINMTDGIGTEKRNSLYLDGKKKKWIKEVSDYAKERGIKVLNRTTTAVGDCTDGQSKKTCIEHNGKYYCWSNEKLLKKRAEKMIQDLNETGAGAVFIHSVDTINSKWHDRGKQCQEKFGDDRFKGSAYLFNLYRDEIRKSFPKMPIIIVPRPYGGSIDSIEHIKKGEMKAKNDLLRFSKMLSPDVYVCHRESSRPNFLSCVKGFRQPMSPCVMAWYLDPFLDGRDFTPMARYFRTYSYPLTNEVADYGTHAASRDKVQSLTFSEFSWNLNSPGSAEYAPTPEKYVDIWDPFGKDMSKNKELQYLVKRVCDDIFGIQTSKYFYNSQLLFTDSKFAKNWQEMKGVLQKGYYNPGLMPDLDNKKCAEFMERIYHNSDIIVKDMETVKKISSNQEIKGIANWYLYNHYHTRAIAHVQTLLLNADIASRKGEHEKAEKLIKNTSKIYVEEEQKLKKDIQSIQGKRHEIWGRVPAVRLQALKALKNRIDLTNVKIQSRAMMAKRRKRPSRSRKMKVNKLKGNKPIEVGLFMPDSKGGKTYGAKGLFNLLKGINDISIEQIDDMSLNTLNKYDCIIFPDCKSLGSIDINIGDLRSYIIKNGGGFYFEHDSCGFNRFPLKDSVFPEIAEVVNRIGELPSSINYKKNDRILKIIKKHPITKGNLKGSSYKQVYFDHLQLANRLGTVLVEDVYGKPVIIAGKIGKGKVVFNGGITLSVFDNSELKEPLIGIEGELIVNSIYWLAKDKKGTTLIMSEMQKKNTTLTNMDASVISFKPQIIPCKTLHDVVLTAQCFNARDMRPISPKVEIAKIDKIDRKWDAEEKVIINAENYPEIKVSLEFSSKEGRGFISKVIKNER